MSDAQGSQINQRWRRYDVGGIALIDLILFFLHADHLVQNDFGYSFGELTPDHALRLSSYARSRAAFCARKMSNEYVKSPIHFPAR